MTDKENSLKNPDEGGTRGRLDESVGETTPHAEMQRVDKGGNRSQDPGED